MGLKSAITRFASTDLNGVATFFTPGSAITFSGSITTSTADDEFVVLLFDAAGDQVATSNPNDFVFSVTPTTPPTGGPPTIVTNTYPIMTPEPSSLLMLSLGLTGLLGLGLTRKRAGAAVAA